MFPKNMKNIIPFIVGILIILVYIKLVNSFDLAIKYSIFPLILGFLFYYDFTLAVIVTIIFSVIFIYNMNYSKNVDYRKKTSKFNINDSIDSEYDYVSNEVNNDDTNNDDTNNGNDDDMNIYSNIEGMSNKRRNKGIDRISAEQNIRSKESNTLLISKDFATKEKTEPISVGKDGTMSGYTMMDYY